MMADGRGYKRTILKLMLTDTNRWHTASKGVPLIVSGLGKELPAVGKQRPTWILGFLSDASALS